MPSTLGRGAPREISQFDGYKRALKLTSKVLWFSVDSSPSFPMLAENEFYGIGDDEVRRFLEDLFVRPTFGARCRCGRS